MLLAATANAVGETAASIEPWLNFITTLIWQGLAAAVVFWLLRTGLAGRISELSFGTFSLKLREIQAEQRTIRRDVDALKFLVDLFLTRHELTHLEKLAGDGVFEFVRGGNRDDKFVEELVRLWYLGLINRKGVESWWALPLSGNLREFAEISGKGREYLRIRSEQLAQEVPTKA